MHLKMSQITRKEVLERKRERYERAGKEHKGKILNEVIELFGYHRKAAIRALQKSKVRGMPHVIGRPREYEPEKLVRPLKSIWLHALQPCGVRLKACMAEWLPAYEQDHRRQRISLNHPFRVTVTFGARGRKKERGTPEERKA